MNLRNALFWTAGLILLVGCETTETAPPQERESVSPGVTNTPAPLISEPVAKAPPGKQSKPQPLISNGAPAKPESTLTESGAPGAEERVGITLKQNSAKQLKEMDELLNLSNTQYNQIVRILAERQIGWDALFEKRGQYTPRAFEDRKWKFFRDYLQRIETVFTPEQAEIWANRAK